MNNVRLTLIMLFAVTVIGCASIELEPREKEGWTVSLEELGITGAVDTLANPRHWRVKQVSSYDPQGGNRDDMYGEYRFDGGIVLADLEGPGCVLRIWARDPWGTVSIFLDDSPGPIIRLPFRDLFSGYLELFSPPLVGQEGGGYYCYVPIPYQKNCRMVVHGGNDPLAYQVTYAELPKRANVETFDLNLTTGDQDFFRRWRNTWNTGRDVRFVDREVEEFHETSRKVHPETDIQLWIIEGPATITELEMSVASKDPDILQKAWVAIYWDGQKKPSVLAPVGALFGTGNASAGDFGGPALGKQDGKYWLRYPMPFKERALIRLINTSKDVIDFAYDVTWRPGSIGHNPYFHARYDKAPARKGRPYTLAKIAGSGHFVGCNLTVSNAENTECLEGDEILVVDGEEIPEFHGTGTDHYFNSVQHFALGEFSAPTHGCTANGSILAAYRAHLTDPIPFDKSFAYLLEHGGQNDAARATYSSVAYWYQRKLNPNAWKVPGSPPVARP